MAKDVDKHFYDRADAHINLSNEQADEIGIGKVSASMMYATARFNAWVAASSCDSGKEMTAARAEMIDYYVGQFRLMLEDNLDDYIKHFDKYMS